MAPGEPQPVPLHPAEPGDFRSLCSTFSPHRAPSPWQPGLAAGCGGGWCGWMLCLEVYVGASLPTPEAQLWSCVGSLQEKHQISRQCGNLGSRPRERCRARFPLSSGCRACPAAAAGDAWPGVRAPCKHVPAEPAALGAPRSCLRSCVCCALSAQLR